jgi:hypothetical protein
VVAGAQLTEYVHPSPQSSSASMTTFKWVSTQMPPSNAFSHPRRFDDALPSPARTRTDANQNRCERIMEKICNQLSRKGSQQTLFAIASFAETFGNTETHYIHMA